MSTLDDQMKNNAAAILLGAIGDYLFVTDVTKAIR